MTALLDIQNLCVSFPATDGSETLNQVLHEVCLTLHSGKTHGLVGESGSGKSITALSVLRLLDDVSSARTAGRVVFQGKNLLDLSRKEMQKIRGNRIAMIFQEPMTSLNPVYSIGNQLMEPLIQHRKLNKDQARQEAIALLDRTGITNPEQRIDNFPHQLSGGQRQRIIIAMALACEPELLIADEPTTALDVTIQEQILELIKDVQQEYHMAMLLITHDLNMIRKIADDVSIMRQGKIVEHNKTAPLFGNPQHDYTKHLLQSLPKGSPEPVTTKESLVRLENLTCRFTIGQSGFWGRNKKTFKAVDNANVTIPRGSTLGIVGESGSGKSTLAFCLLGLHTYQGNVYYSAQKTEINLSGLSGKAMRPLRKELQIVFQDPFSSLSPRLSIEQIVGEGLSVHNIGKTKDERRSMVCQALRDVELDPDMASRYPHEFSGGQRQRIAIARAIILRPRLLILDEPTSALDMTIQAQVIALLKQLQQRFQITYIFITHDLRVIKTIANDIIVMQHGKIIESGPAATVFQNPREQYTQKLFHAAFSGY